MVRLSLSRRLTLLRLAPRENHFAFPEQTPTVPVPAGTRAARSHPAGTDPAAGRVQPLRERPATRQAPSTL